MSEMDQLNIWISLNLIVFVSQTKWSLKPPSKIKNLGIRFVGLMLHAWILGKGGGGVGGKVTSSKFRLIVAECWKHL